MANKVCIVESDKITDGTNLMKGNTDLVKWDSNLSNLINGNTMFGNCSALTSFDSNLPILMNGYTMFSGCTALASFNVDLSSLDDGTGMFSYCTNLTSFNADLSSLTNGYFMFYGCEKLTSFNSDLSSLTNGWMMFVGCKLDAESLNKIAISLSKIDTPSTRITINLGVDYYDNGDGSGTPNDIKSCYDLNLIRHKGWVLDSFGNLEWRGEDMKYEGCTDVDEVNAKDANYLTTDIVNGVWTEHLPDLIVGGEAEGYAPLFRSCSTLNTFNADLSSLEDGYHMFGSCNNLTAFNSNLSNLKEAYMMFHHCTNLTSFKLKLRNLFKGYSMFWECSNLTSFTSDLSSLTNGFYMFEGCKLDTASVQNIADTIKDVTSLADEPYISGAVYKQIDIGIGNSIPNDSEIIAFNTIASKGWTVYVNGSTYTPTGVASVMTLDEDGNEVETPIPYYAKPVPSDEESATYIDAEGNYFNIVGAQFIYGDDLSTYGMFTCEEDAAFNMGLTKIDK